MIRAQTVADLHADRVLDAIKKQKERILNGLVDYAAQTARYNVAHDTGFAADMVYSLHVGSGGVPAQRETRIDRHGRQVVRTARSISAPPFGAASYGCAANYAYTLEMRTHVFSQAFRDAWAQLQQSIQGGLDE